MHVAWLLELVFDVSSKFLRFPSISYCLAQARGWGSRKPLEATRPRALFTGYAVGLHRTFAEESPRLLRELHTGDSRCLGVQVVQVKGPEPSFNGSGKASRVHVT